MKKAIILLVTIVTVLTSCKNGADKKEPQSTGTEPAVNTATEVAPDTLAVDTLAFAEGKKIYLQYCANCHQINGSGVPNLNPPLQKTTYVLGDKNKLISILLDGSNVGLDVNGKTYSNSMPSHNYLSDKQIAEVLSYIRNSFGNKASAVTEDEVKHLRS
ncbi:c-type cytochrome [Zhouia sp. PK063]|uniref:c-type cytochrome n=1 Tax=Zhouia sp. PK063 TaxID=3373602 RepID=UPI0037AD28E7